MHLEYHYEFFGANENHTTCSYGNPVEIPQQHSYRNPMEIFWNRHSIPMEIQWKTHRFPMKILWKSYGHPIDFLWKSYGHPINFQRKSFGNLMEIPQISYGKSMEILQISCGNPMAIPQISSGNSMEILWKSHRYSRGHPLPMEITESVGMECTQNIIMNSLGPMSTIQHSIVLSPRRTYI